jgi:hypothetical protein
LKPVRHRRLLIALIVIIVGVLVGLAWLVWPGTDLTLRLKLVRTGIEDGKTGVLFRVEGAEQYELHIENFRYLLGRKPASSLPSLTLDLGTREFWATAAPEYYADVGDQGWQVQASVFVIGPAKKNIRKALWAIRNAWPEYRFWRRTAKPVSFLSLAKSRWNYNGNLILSRQTITSELITNTPPH